MSLRPSRFFGKLFLLNIILMAVILGVSLAMIVQEFSTLRERELAEHLTAYANALTPAARDVLDRARAAEANALAREVGSGDALGIRVTLVLPDGTVLGDSQAEPANLESHADRPEIIEAMVHGSGRSTRWSASVSRRLEYAAVRVGPPEHPRGVVRVAMPVQAIGAGVDRTRRLAVAIGSAAVGAAVLLALGLAALWSGRIARLTEAARSIARGDLSARIPEVGRDEISRLARSLNRMRERLASQLDTIDRQHRTLESLVAQLGEGVIAADDDGRLVLVNAEARRLLQLEAPMPARRDAFDGLPVEQCIGHPKLLELLHPRDSQASPATPDELSLDLETSSGPVSLMVRGSDIVVPGPAGSGAGEVRAGRVGRLIVLTDVTALTKVAQVKTDFAANASHELRTPLSAIRAAVETLRTLDGIAQGSAASQFLDVIDRHRGRMEAMVRDLLDLARVESPADKFKPVSLRPHEVLRELHSVFVETLEAKSLRWEPNVDERCTSLFASPELLRIVLRNLVDNAIKFTEPGGLIRVNIRSEPGRAIVEVADNGCGIPESEQQRVFERFYQVKRDRSGPERGTGLGLSIVRHAVTAMRGTVELQSELGKGTRVTVTIPER